jgi:hypothetical protein
MEIGEGISETPQPKPLSLHRYTVSDKRPRQQAKQFHVFQRRAQTG